jgi:hypothetical protein
METLLIAITIVSAATAFGLGAVVIRMVREERRRSDARVEALMEMTSDATPSAPRVGQPAHVLAPSHFHRIPQAARPDAGTRNADLVVADDLELNGSVTGVRAMFTEEERHSPWGRRFAAAAACATVVAILGSLVLSRSAEEADAAGSDTVVEERSASAPLELLSLRHTMDPDGFVITGVVQNPRGGALLSDVIATASLFDKDGSLLVTARAPLDFIQLRPGDESPFVVRVASTADVARYRVGFRHSNGGVIGHVDRRGPGPLARNE